MDILNLSQNAGHASGLPMQAETIAGQSGAQSSAGQTQPGFNDALMNVVSTLMGGQGKNALGITVSAQPMSAGRGRYGRSASEGCLSVERRCATAAVAGAVDDRANRRLNPSATRVVRKTR